MAAKGNVLDSHLVAGGSRSHFSRYSLNIFTKSPDLGQSKLFKTKFQNYFAPTPFARKKFTFLFIITLFFSDSWLWVSFLGNYFMWNSFSYDRVFVNGSDFWPKSQILKDKFLDM